MNFYFTFGQKYRREPHPCGGHPDGWFRVVADSVENATRKMQAECGQQWSMVYTEEGFDRSFYPRGELRSMDFDQIQDSIRKIQIKAFEELKKNI